MATRVEDRIKRLIKPQPKGPQDTHYINILLLGETGVGKSTWINAFTNYWHFNTLEEAADAEELVVPIPTTFKVSDPVARMTWHTIQAGAADDYNERSTPGESATLSPRDYKFYSADARLCVRIIDTPGIGDTGGIDQDALNLEQILFHLGAIDELHGICILMRPDVSRLTTPFVYCVKGLLARLHKSATANVVCCFTNTRGTNYEPGDTIACLQKLITEFGIEGVTLTDDMIYCVDNEAVRYLATIKSGKIQYNERRTAQHAESWEHSAQEIGRLLGHIASLPPHDVSHTRDLNEARDMVAQLARPIAEFSANIQTNMNVLEELRAELERDEKVGLELTAKVNPTVFEVNMRRITPTVVCTAPSCIEQLYFGSSHVNYKTRCHDPCDCKLTLSTRLETPGAPGLWLCSIFEYKDKNKRGSGSDIKICKGCGCPWRTHMRTQYEQVRSEASLLDDNVMTQLNKIQGTVQKTRFALERVQSKIKGAEHKQQLMLKLSSKFARFLKDNAVTQDADAVRKFLMISIASTEAAGPNSSPSVLVRLHALLAKYEELVKIQDNVAAQTVTAKDIPQLVQEAFDLPEVGKQLEEFCRTQDNRMRIFKIEAKEQKAARSWQAGHGSGVQGQVNVLQERLDVICAEVAARRQKQRKEGASPEKEVGQETVAVTASSTAKVAQEDVGRAPEMSKTTKFGNQVMDTISGVKFGKKQPKK